MKLQKCNVISQKSPVLLVAAIFKTPKYRTKTCKSINYEEENAGLVQEIVNKTITASFDANQQYPNPT